MGLGAIEADVVEAAEILALGKPLGLVDVGPLFPQLLAVGGEQQLRVLLAGRAGPGEVRPDDAADPDRRREVLPAVGLLDVIAEVRDAVAVQRLQRLALQAHLPGASRVGGDRHVEVGQGEEGVRGTAGADLDDRAALLRAGRIPDRLEETGHAGDRVLGRGMRVREVRAGRRAVEVLAVDLQPVEAPGAERLLDEGRRVLTDRRIGGAEVERVPPADLPRRAVGAEEQPVRMGDVGRGARVRRQRRPPELRLEACFVDAIHERLHVGVQSPSATCHPSSSVAQRKPRRFATGSVPITWSTVKSRP